jgi:hypothetical protein
VFLTDEESILNHFSLNLQNYFIGKKTNINMRSTLIFWKLFLNEKDNFKKFVSVNWSVEE